MDVFIFLPDNVLLWPITLYTVYFTALTSLVLDMMVSEKTIMPKLQLLTSNETQLNALKFVREAKSLSYKNYKKRMTGRARELKSSRGQQ